MGPGILNPGTADALTADALTADALTANALAAVFAGAPSTAGLTADARALVAYSRSTVETTSKDGVPGELNVASAGLKRPAEGFLMAPLESLHESSPFGLRTSPLTGSSGEFHWGQDYAAACGTRVYSADAGVVRAVGWHPWGGGNRVEIDHGNGLITTYNHLEGIAVKKGDSVRVGEVIARVGTTGSSTGCHLHFETILNGSHKNPHDWVLLPIVQTDQLGTFEMTSYTPDAGLPSNASLGWAIPGSRDGRHEVTGGTQETRVAAVLRTPRTPYFTSAAATPTPSIWDALSPTRTRSGTPTLQSSWPSSGSPSETTTPGGSQLPSGTPDPSDPPTTSAPGTYVPPPTESPTPTPEPTAPPVPPPPSSAEPPAPPPTQEPTQEPAPPPPVVEPVLPPPPPPPPPVVEPVLPPPPPPPVVEPVLPPPPPPPVVEPVLPPPPPPAPAPVPTSEPAQPAPTASTVPSVTTDPSLTPGP